MSVDKLTAQLEKYSPEEQAALLQAIMDKDRKDRYILYWEPFESTPGANDYQRPIFDCFEEGVKEVYVTGGNRSGKTVDGAAIAMAYLLGKKYFEGSPAAWWVNKLPIPENRPRAIWVVGLDFATVTDTIMGEYFIRGKNVPPMLPRNWESIGFNVLQGKNPKIIAPDGSTLTFKSADSGREKMQSASVDLVWIDEEPDVTIYEECWQRTVDCDGIVLVTVTPLVDSASGARVPWIFRQVTKARQGDKSIRVVQLNVLLNPTLSEQAKEELVKKWAGHPEENARLYGEFIQRSGLVYPMVKRGTHIVPPIHIERDVFRVACIDPAPSGPTACVWAAIYPEGDVRIYKEYKQSNLTVDEHAKNILMVNGGEPIDMWLIDPVGGGQRNAETHKTIAQLYKENGVNVKFPPLDEDFGLEITREYLTAAGDESSRSPKLVIEETCVGLIDELASYVWSFYDRGEKKGQTKGRPRKLNDHEINATQYICGMRLKGRRVAFQKLTADQARKRAQFNSY